MHSLRGGILASGEKHLRGLRVSSAISVSTTDDRRIDPIAKARRGERAERSLPPFRPFALPRFRDPPEPFFPIRVHPRLAGVWRLEFGVRSFTALPPTAFASIRAFRGPLPDVRSLE